MKVAILCGGLGTRIRDVSADLPKPMIPIGGMPILWHVMRHYARHGHDEFVLLLGHRGEVIKDFFLNYESRTRDVTVRLGRSGSVTFHDSPHEVEWTVTLLDTGVDAMTGARLRRARSHLVNETFMLTYGDGVSDVDLSALAAFHERNGRTATVTGVRPPGRFGELAVDEDGRATEFNEKPQATDGRISGGFFVFEPGVFDYLDDREDLVLEEGPLRALVRDGQLSVFEHPGFWQCMDTNRDWTLLDRLARSATPPWKTW
jgi:glucose-1-phosphate cytidylyltransferase